MHQLESAGFVGTVRRRESRIAVRVERQGRTVYGLDIEKGGPFGDSSLHFVLGGNRIFSSMGSSDRTYTKEEFFTALWDRIVEQSER